MRRLAAVLTIFWAVAAAHAEQPLATSSAGLTTLRRSKVFTTARVGLGQELTTEAVAFGHLMTRRATSEFLELTRHGTPAGRLYGLCGLKALNDRAYASLRSKMSARRDRMLGTGCIAVRTTVDKVLAVRKSLEGKEESTFDVVCETLIDHSTKAEEQR